MDSLGTTTKDINLELVCFYDSELASRWNKGMHSADNLTNIPLNLRLLIDGKVFFIDDELKNPHTYDREEVLSVTAKMLKKHPKNQHILRWLDSNLPDSPDKY